MYGDLRETQARKLVEGLRFQASLLIPDQLPTYDLIYGSRLDRLIDQFITSQY